MEPCYSTQVLVAQKSESSLLFGFNFQKSFSEFFQVLARLIVLSNRNIFGSELRLPDNDQVICSIVPSLF